MLTITLRGNNGNMMFQIATLYAHSLRTNISYAVPATSGKRNQFVMPFLHLPQFQDHELTFENFYIEERFGIYNPLPKPNENNNLHIQGYFQSEKYFKEYRKEVIELFQLPKYNPLSDTVSIHLRRTDSLRFIEKLPQPTDKYFLEAIDYFVTLGFKKFLVFSDDWDYAIQYFKTMFKNSFSNCDLSFSGPQDAKISLGIMASCAHGIIVNSTFSWWGRWLSENENKITISPHVDSWFGEKYKHRLSAQDIVCENWIQIKY